MNNIITFIVILLLSSLLVFILSGATLFFDEIEGINSKKDKIIFVISFLTSILSLALMTIYFIKNPQPTFREVCEANNGTYIDNNGRAGDSCIYNK